MSGSKSLMFSYCLICEIRLASLDRTRMSDGFVFFEEDHYFEQPLQESECIS